MVSKTLAAALLTLGTVVSARPSLGSVRCGTEITETHKAQGKALYEIEQSMLKADAQSLKEPITVDTYFHLVSKTESRPATDKQLEDQLKVLNDAFGPHQIFFNHINTTFTANALWAGGVTDYEMKKELRRGDYSALNIYFVDVPVASNPEVLGFCFFPMDASPVFPDRVNNDGCTINHQTIPGGSLAPYNLGATTVHEVGHWFHLDHPFEGGCFGSGDHIDDTPPQLTPSHGCEKGKDTCPSAGLDSIHNWMDYSEDACLEVFTPGQETRMHNSWKQYRQPKSSE